MSIRGVRYVVAMYAAMHVALMMPALTAGAENVNDLSYDVSHSSDDFLIFDATLYSDKPDLRSFDVRALPVIYQRQLWNDSKNLDSVPGRETIEAVAASIADDAAVICVDIEHWPLKGDNYEVARSLDKYLEVIRRFRAVGYTRRIGFYGAPPVRDYWRVIKGPNSAAYRRWRSENNRLAPLAAEVDVLFPSLYTFYSDQEGWRRAATAQLKAAKSYGKPVYAFLWPQFHESNRLLGGRYIGDDYWRMELETVRSYADGVVIWGGWGDGKPAKWDSKASWWQVTKAFLEDSKRATAPKNR